MELTINLSPEEVQRAAEPAVRALLGEDIAERLVSTATAAAMLEVSENQFLLMATAAEMERVLVGPRLKRWRLADVKALIASFPKEKA